MGKMMDLLLGVQMVLESYLELAYWSVCSRVCECGYL